MNQNRPDKAKTEAKEKAVERKQLRNFGLTIGLAFLILSALLFWKDKPTWPWFTIPGGVLILSGLTVPMVLGPIERVWMKGARALGWVMTRLILGVLFIVIFSPAGLIMRLLGKDPMNLRIDRNKSSYWLPRDPADSTRERLERMF